MAALANQTAYHTTDESKKVTSTVIPAPTLGTAGAENIFVNLNNGKSVMVTNVTSHVFDPPPFSLWNAAVTYALGNVVQYTDSNYYIAIQAGSNHVPTTATTFWAVLPLQYFFNGEDFYRNELNLPLGGITSSASAAILLGDELLGSGQTFASSTNVVNPGGMQGATANLQAGLILNDHQAGIPPHSLGLIRTRIVFTRTAPGDGSSMVPMWFFCDEMKGISCSSE